MPTYEDVQQQLLDRIGDLTADEKTTRVNSRAVLELAEAWAWLTHPGQAHGGTTTVRSG